MYTYNKINSSFGKNQQQQQLERSSGTSELINREERKKKNQPIHQEMDVEQQKHFVLVHGACHGAWCWYKVATLLQTAGHKVTALDLSASGIHPKQPLDLQSISDYFQPLMTFMDSVSEKVILVAHSLGGLSVSKAMECYPEKISVVVFATAFIPGPELSPSAIALKYLQRHAPIYGCNDTFDHLPQNLTETYIFGLDLLASNFYQLCPPEDFTLVKMLGRPTRIFSEEDLLKEVTLTRERYGSVNRVYIVADEDLAIFKDFQLWMVEKNPMHEVKEIKRSDHMVMLSKPYELFACLEEITAKFQN